MKTVFYPLMFCVVLCGCQSAPHAPSSMVGVCDTTMRWDSAGTTRRHFTGGFQTTDGLTLFYQGWQPADTVRAVVCLVHGLGEHSGRYAWYAASLCNDGFAVFTFDLRGHGRSMGQRGHFPTFEIALDDISLFEQKALALYPGKRLFLYGHSMGGNFVINYCLRRHTSVAGVIASAPFLKVALKVPAWKMASANVLSALWPTFSLWNGIVLEDVTRDTAVQRSLKNDPLVHNRITARYMRVFAAGTWALAHANELKVPLLLMHGSADRITSEPASAQFAQNAGRLCTFKVWPGFFHQLYEEPGKEAIVKYVTAWMDSCMR